MKPRRALALCALCALVVALGAPEGAADEQQPDRGPGGPSPVGAAEGPALLPPKRPTADHSGFEQLAREFGSGPEVTRACLECHTEAARQVMQTSHWTWICPRAKAELSRRQKRAVLEVAASTTSQGVALT